MSWFHTGMDQEAKQQATSRGKSGGTYHFWLAVKESRKVLFLEDVNDTSFGFWEHKLKVNDDWKNAVRITCTKGFAPCPVCEEHRWWDGEAASEFKRYHVNVVSVMDLTPWQGKDGAHACTRKLIIMKSDVYNLLTGKSAKRKENGAPEGIKHWLFDVMRHSNKGKNGNETSFSVGNDFEPISQWTPDMEMPFEIDLHGDGNKAKHPGLVLPDGTPIEPVPVDYEKEFAPMSPEDIKEIFVNSKVVDGAVFKPKSGAGDWPEGKNPYSEVPTGAGSGDKSVDY